MHTITQAEGGECGDPLMFALCSPGVHPALQALQVQVQQDERFFAFLDDIHVVSPDRVNAILGLLQNALCIHSAIHVHHGAQLASLSATHDQLIEKVPTLPDLQYAWMVLLYCCAAGAKHTLRLVHPELTAGFAAHHDASLADVSVNFWG